MSWFESIVNRLRRNKAIEFWTRAVAEGVDYDVAGINDRGYRSAHAGGTPLGPCALRFLRAAFYSDLQAADLNVVS